MSKSQHFLIAVTAINAALALVSCTQLQQARASAGAAPVLRGSGLEIVDDHGQGSVLTLERRRGHVWVPGDLRDAAGAGEPPTIPDS